MHGPLQKVDGMVHANGAGASGVASRVLAAAHSEAVTVARQGRGIYSFASSIGPVKGPSVQPDSELNFQSRSA